MLWAAGTPGSPSVSGVAPSDSMDSLPWTSLTRGTASPPAPFCLRARHMPTALPTYRRNSTAATSKQVLMLSADAIRV